jgi:hypothetical protein
MSKTAKKKHGKEKRDASSNDDVTLAVDPNPDSRCGGDNWIGDR